MSRLYAWTILAYRKKGMSEEDYHAYLSTHHSNVVKNHLMKFGIVSYTMTHNTSETKSMAAKLLETRPGGEEFIADYDCVVQVMFHDVQDYLKARDDPFFQEVIVPDHAHFADSERTVFLAGWVEKFIVDAAVV
ncbi:hypothetical protein P170DRAFT_359794 [Aspergillus steynii IBT 23096]|uniref:EthD domain-containing protein n=1 Tax=Aspergillus steynii IBT 23096 TaxID=1392250 RepID=A0A2I2G410_9EURO|nr:uncharacterized protein P170DRAFT_359794 [Aspergillus steynii IBT 23096]PLB47617.1 hypothetical protein P170DRAFT_359794 [Aspergillus steynii IBT 23096]